MSGARVGGGIGGTNIVCPERDALADAILDDESGISDPLDRCLVVTQFAGHGATKKKEFTRSLRDLAPAILSRTAPDKHALPWLKLARFGEQRTPKGSLRHDANVTAVEGVEADYDGGTMGVDEAVTLLKAARLAALVYTSPSHTLDAPRWRILAPFSESLSPDKRADHCARLNGVLGGILAGESFALSQAYFYGSVASNPAHRVEVVKGRPLDLAHDLDATAVRKGAKPVKAGNVVPLRPKKDESRSAVAFRLARDMARAGKTEAEWRDHADVAPWVAEKPEREVTRTWERAVASLDGDAPLDGFALTEDGIALAFAARHREKLRFCHDAGRWYRWSGTIWHPERTKLAFSWARDTCRDLLLAGAAQDKGLAKAATAAGVERFAQADRAFAVTAEQWDRDPMLLGTPGGTVDLRTGELRAGRQEDHITKATAVTPAPLASFDADLECTAWLRFLDEATGSDPGLIRFLQQWFGYSLTGQTKEHALLFIHGPGGNGKGVFLSALTGILGDYAATAPMHALMASKFDQHTTDLAMLAGARLVTASETEEGRAWAEARIKQMTGGDPITARFMRKDNFTFLPQFKLTIIGNNRPVLNNVDAAARRRFNIVPFEHIPARKDADLPEKLRKEWPGILTWAILGCLDWQANGLARPEVVQAATAEYFESQDTFGQWLEECCETERTYVAATADLLDSWQMFCRGRGERDEASPRSFADRLAARGFNRIKNVMSEDGRRGRGFDGLRLHTQEEMGGDHDL